MLKNKFLLGSILATFVFGTHVSSANALELDEDTRTVTLDGKGNTVVISVEQVNVESDYLIMLVRLVMLVVLRRQTPMLV